MEERTARKLFGGINRIASQIAIKKPPGGRRKALKRLNPDKEIQGNPRKKLLDFLGRALQNLVWL